MSATAYIHTSDKRCIGAPVARHSMRRNSRHADQFDVPILHTRDHGFWRRRHGQRGGARLSRRSRRCG